MPKYLKLLRFTFPFIYFIGLFYIVFLAQRRRHLSARVLNIVPVRGLINEFMERHIGGSFNFYSNFFGNIVLFMPFSFFLIVICGMNSYKTVILSALGLSIAIEAMQFVFNVGVADINDVLLNVFGAVLGVVIFRITCKNSHS